MGTGFVLCDNCTNYDTSTSAAAIAGVALISLAAAGALLRLARTASGRARSLAAAGVLCLGLLVPVAAMLTQLSVGADGGITCGPARHAAQARYVDESRVTPQQTQCRERGRQAMATAGTLATVGLVGGAASALMAMAAVRREDAAEQPLAAPDADH